MRNEGKREMEKSVKQKKEELRDTKKRGTQKDWENEMNRGHRMIRE